MKVIAYKLDRNDTVIMEIPATNPLTVNTVLATNLSISGVAMMALERGTFFKREFVIGKADFGKEKKHYISL